jgi:hypothetical protein
MQLQLLHRFGKGLDHTSPKPSGLREKPGQEKKGAAGYIVAEAGSTCSASALQTPRARM